MMVSVAPRDNGRWSRDGWIKLPLALLEFVQNEGLKIAVAIGESRRVCTILMIAGPAARR